MDELVSKPNILHICNNSTRKHRIPWSTVGIYQHKWEYVNQIGKGCLLTSYSGMEKKCHQNILTEETKTLGILFHRQTHTHTNVCIHRHMRIYVHTIPSLKRKKGEVWGTFTFCVFCNDSTIHTSRFHWCSKLHACVTAHW